LFIEILLELEQWVKSQRIPPSCTKRFPMIFFGSGLFSLMHILRWHTTWNLVLTLYIT